MAGWCHVPFYVFGKKLAIGEDNRKAPIRQKAEATAEARSRHLPGVRQARALRPQRRLCTALPARIALHGGPQRRGLRASVARSVLGSEGKGNFLGKGNWRPVALVPRGQRAARRSWARNVSQAGRAFICGRSLPPGTLRGSRESQAPMRLLAHAVSSPKPQLSGGKK